MLKSLYGNFLEMPAPLMVVLCICFISPLLFITKVLVDSLIEHGFWFFIVLVSFLFHFYAGILLLNKSARFFTVFVCSGFLVSFSPLLHHPYGTENWAMYLIGSLFNLAIVLMIFLYIKTNIKVKMYFEVQP